MSVFIDNNAGGVSIFPDAPGGSLIGPFKFGTNYYVASQGDPGNGNRLAMYKSTDGGNTWTGPLNQAGSHIIAGGQGYWSAAAVGTKVYVVFFETIAGLVVWQFDTTTDLWGGQFTANVVALPSNGTAVGTYNESTFRPGPFVLRSNGSLVFTLIEMENVGGFKYRTTIDICNNAGVFAISDAYCGENGVAGHDLPAGAILGLGDRTHVFFVEYNGKTLKHRTVTTLNAIQASQTVANDLFDPGGVNTQSLLESVGIPTFDPISGTVSIPYKDTNGHMKMANATSADTPVWTTEQIDTTITVLKGGQAVGSTVSSAYYDGGGRISVIFLDNQTPPTILNLYRSTKFGASWSTPGLLIPTGIPSGGGINIQSIHAKSLASALGLVAAIFYTPDVNSNYILSFAAFSDASPPVSSGSTPVAIGVWGR